MLNWLKAIGRLPKILVICVAAVVAVSSMGVGYAYVFMSQPISTQCVVTPSCDCKFSWVVSNDDGHQTSIIPYGVIDPGDNNVGEIYDYWAPKLGYTSSRDPYEPPTACGQPAPRYEKDVARTKASIKCDPDYIEVLLNNAYPLYNPTVCFAIKCPSSSATITKIIIDLDATTAAIETSVPWLTASYTGIYIGEVIPAGTEAMGSLRIRVEQPAQQNTTYKIKIMIETQCLTRVCGTGYAYGNSLAKCFLQIPNIGSNNWGWSNGPITLNTTSWTKTWPLYLGAAQCNLSNGTNVGTVTVTYNGTSKRMTVTYNINEGYILGETELWIGTQYLPKNKYGQYITSPGQFPYKHSITNERTDTYTFTVSSSGTYPWYGKSIYIAAHAGVCWWR